MHYAPINEAINADGLRIILVKGFPSPWGQAAKAMIEYKGLDYIAGPHEAGGANPEIVAWAGVNSGPVVAWNREAPLNRWNDILFLLERLAPHKSLLPDEMSARVQVLGLSHEICGQLGLGWNARLWMFQPVLESGAAPAGFVQMGQRYGYNESDVAVAPQRTAAMLEHLAAVLTAQQQRGSEFFVGDSVTAVDFYWAAFSNLVQIQSAEDCPIDDAVRPMFQNVPAAVTAACAPILIQHRDRIMRAHFKLPMEL